MEKFGTATLQSDLMKVRKANSNAKVGQFEQEKLWFGTYFDLIEGVTIAGLVSLCYDKAVSTSRGERRLHAASARSRVKLRVSRCSRGLGHARGLSSKNTL